MVPDGPIAWRLLRPETVGTDDGPVEMNPRPRAVLIRLLLTPDTAVTADEIAHFVWGEHLPRTPANSVARFVADLRRSLGPWRGRIVTSPDGYRVVVRAGELDVDEARGVLDVARRLSIVDPERAHVALRRGLDIVGDGPNAVLVDLPDAAAVLRGHDEIRIAMLELHADVELQRGQPWDLIPMLERATDSYPFHETFALKLMVALDRAGRKVEALRAARRVRAALVDAGLEPCVELTRLESAIAAGHHDGGRPGSGAGITAGGAAATSRPQHGIAEPTTTMVGRLAELQELEDAVGHHRVVSIVGLGGAGKTRVALALVRPIEALGTAVYRVGLRSADDDALVLPTVAAVLGVPTGGATDARALARAVSHDAFVLVLDNCEHVRAPCVELIEALRELAPAVRVVTTTREALGVTDERVFLLGMLAVPEPEDVSADPAAVSLLIDRAEVHLRGAEVAAGTLGHLCDIARTLGGHPLALEVAAAQLAYLTPEDLNGRIATLFAGDPAERTTGALVSIMDWTWDQLDPALQQLLARLSVFGGGWTVAAAEAVCAEQRSLRVELGELAGRGLVASTSVQGVERFEMLEPVRSYAFERLEDRGEADVLRDRVVRWLTGVVGHWSVAEQHVWAAPSAVLFPEHTNLVGALGHLLDEDRLEELAHLAIRSSGMWINHGFADEVKRWLSPVVNAPSLPHETRSAAAAMVLAAAHALGELDSLLPLGLRSLELAAGEPHDWVPAVAGFLSVWVLFNPGEPGALTSGQLHEHALAAAERSASSDTNRAVADLYQAHVLFCLRQYDAAAVLFAEVRAEVQQAGRLMLVAELGHGLSLFMAGRSDDALASVAGWKSRSDTDDWHYMLDIVGAVIMGGCGDATRATADLAAAVRRLRPATIWGRADEIQTAFGLLADRRGEHDLATTLLSTAATRDVLLTVATVELVARRRGVADDAGWFEVAQECWGRVMPDSGGRGDASSVPELVKWWSTDGGIAPAVGS